MQLHLQVELAEEKSQPPHSMKSLWWAQQMYLTKEKNRYSEHYKIVFCAGAKILTNFSPNPTRKARLKILFSPTRDRVDDTVGREGASTWLWNSGCIHVTLELVEPAKYV